MLYQQLRRYLRTPRRIIIDPAQRECDPPEDPDWPAPTTHEEVLELMLRLPHWIRIVCALTAAEMVLPILSEEQIEAPHRSIEITWQWLDNNASDAEVQTEAATTRDAAAAIWASRHDTPDYFAAYSAVMAAALAGWAVNNIYRWPASGIQHAARAIRSGPFTRDVDARFYHEWWDLCRCRLAFVLEARI